VIFYGILWVDVAFCPMRFLFVVCFLFVSVFVFGLVGLSLVEREVFVARVVRDAKVTVPMRVRDLLDICDGDSMRLKREVGKMRVRFGGR